jgi:Uri superfamily endonuclease
VFDPWSPPIDWRQIARLCRPPRLQEAPDGPLRVRGTYVVVYRLYAEATMTVGGLGTLLFKPGYYAYLGSAFGGGGVCARSGRHLQPRERKKWNIDYFTPHALPVEVWWTHDPAKRECAWSRVMAGMPGASWPELRFGAADCKGCKAHFYRFGRMPSCRDFVRRLGELSVLQSEVFRQRIARAARSKGPRRDDAAQVRGAGSNSPGASRPRATARGV